MITIDGSQGEGGGQVLRTSLGLSLATGKPFCIENIRAGRKKPGLMRQHLTAVNAAVRIGCAEVKGNAIGSQRLEFIPQTVNAGKYEFSIGTAGSCTLVMQTVLPALLKANEPSELTLEGGTHNPFAPPFDFLDKTFLPILNRMGPEVKVEFERPGFYPAGGGKMRVTITPARQLEPLELVERGDIDHRLCRVLISRLPENIANREIKYFKQNLNWKRECFRTEVIENSQGPGNIMIVEIGGASVTEVFTGFGEKGVSSEQVAAQVVKAAQDYLAKDAPVGRYLADQLLIPMAMAGGGRIRTLPPSRHTTTNIEVIRRFLDVDFKVEKQADSAWLIEIIGSSESSTPSHMF